MIFNKKEIEKFLPHRDPFLFVDEVTIEDRPKVNSINEILNTENSAKKQILKDHFCFQGHFPNNPILPGVIQVEMIAQTGIFSFYHLLKQPIDECNLSFRLIKVNEFKFKNEGVPGDFKIVTKLISTKSGFTTFEGQIIQNEKVISEGSTIGIVLNNNILLK